MSLTRRRGPTCQPNDPNLRLLDRPISLPSQVAQIAPNARLIAPLNKERAVTAGRAGVEVRARCAVAIDRTRHPLESRARPGAASAPAPAPAPLLPLEAQMSAPSSSPSPPPLHGLLLVSYWHQIGKGEELIVASGGGEICD